MLRSPRLYVLLMLVAVLLWLNLRAANTIDVVRPVERAGQSLLPALQTRLSPLKNNANQRLTDLPLPVVLSRPTLDVAARDPFVLRSASTAVQLPAKPTLQPPISAQALVPPPPVAPPLNMTFTGRMTAPDGSQIVYVELAASTHAIAVGQNLSNGYRVETITPQAIEFSFLPLKTIARLDLPSTPKFEIR